MGPFICLDYIKALIDLFNNLIDLLIDLIH